MKIRTIFSFCTLLLLSCVVEYDTDVQMCTATNYNNTSHPKNTQLHDWLLSYQHLNLPGLVLAVLDSSGSFWAEATGYASIEAEIPMQTCHLHHSASVAKMYIAVTLLLLYEKNAVNLDKKAIEYLPADVPMIPNLTKVTVRQLLNHSSGIPDFVNSSFIEVFNDPYMNKSWKDYLNKYVSNQKSLFPPGKNHHYCNTNYLLLGLIIERVSGNQLGEAVQNFLLIPAGLSATFYKASPNYPKIPAVTDNYFSHYNDYLQNCTGIQQHFADIAMGYEGIIARPDDYLQFLHSLMNGNILQDSTFKIMTECSSSDESNVYGMGILKHGTIYGHSGRSIGTMTCLFHDTTNNTTFFYASNRGPYCETVMDTLFYSEMYNSLVSILSH